MRPAVMRAQQHFLDSISLERRLLGPCNLITILYLHLEHSGHLFDVLSVVVHRDFIPAQAERLEL